RGPLPPPGPVPGLPGGDLGVGEDVPRPDRGGHVGQEGVEVAHAGARSTVREGTSTPITRSATVSASGSATPSTGTSAASPPSTTVDRCSLLAMTVPS